MQTILALAAGTLHPEVFTFHTWFYTSAHLRLPRARELYAYRKTQGERHFAEIKQCMRFLRFSLRGCLKANGERNLVCAAFDSKTIWKAAAA